MTSKARFELRASKALAAALTALTLMLPVGTANAAEILMFVRPGCIWCELWRKEIGPIYAKTPEGRQAPLQEIDINNIPPTLKLASPIVYTPTFVVVSNGAEAGRIIGYPGADFFWSLLSRVLLEVAAKEP